MSSCMINSHANELAAAARHWASSSLQRWWSEYAFFPKRLCRIHWEKGNDLFALFFICKTRVAEHSHLLSDGGLPHASYSSTVAASICRLDHSLHKKYLVLCSSQMRHSWIEKRERTWLAQTYQSSGFSTGLLPDPWFVAHGLYGSWSRHFGNPLPLSLTIHWNWWILDLHLCMGRCMCAFFWEGWFLLSSHRQLWSAMSHYTHKTTGF